MRIIAIVLLLALCATAVCAQTTDVPKDHWAYEAIRQLADRGYVLGYPDGKFLGDRPLTRYEFATIVARILNEVDEKITAAKATAPTVSTPAESGQLTVPSTAEQAGLSKQDIESINKLVDEFKVELAVIGTRLDKVESTVTELKAQLESIDAAVNDEEGVVRTTASDVSKLKKIKIGGYIQSRYQNFDPTKDYTPANQVPDTFLVRRARVKVTANPTDRSTAVVQLDFGKDTTVVKDTYLAYTFGDSPASAPTFQVGQQNWWFGYDVPYSSSKRETPERAMFVRRFFPGERDQGAVLFGPQKPGFNWTAAVYNGTGTEKNSAQDLNNAKDYLGRLYYCGGNLNFGVSGYVGQGAWTTFGDASTYLSDVDKVRYGADLQYYLHNITFKGEYIRGKGFDQAAGAWDQGEYADGYYAQLNFNLTNKNMLVARYSSMSQDPTAPQYGRVNAWELGFIRWLDDNTRFKLFYKINNEQYNEIDDNDGLVAEWITTY